MKEPSSCSHNQHNNIQTCVVLCYTIAKTLFLCSNRYKLPTLPDYNRCDLHSTYLTHCRHIQWHLATPSHVWIGSVHYQEKNCFVKCIYPCQFSFKFIFVLPPHTPNPTPVCCSWLLWWSVWPIAMVWSPRFV